MLQVTTHFCNNIMLQQKILSKQNLMLTEFPSWEHTLREQALWEHILQIEHRGRWGFYSCKALMNLKKKLLFIEGLLLWSSYHQINISSQLSSIINFQSWTKSVCNLYKECYLSHLPSTSATTASCYWKKYGGKIAQCHLNICMKHTQKRYGIIWIGIFKRWGQ